MSENTNPNSIRVEIVEDGSIRDLAYIGDCDYMDVSLDVAIGSCFGGDDQDIWPTSDAPQNVQDAFNANDADAPGCEEMATIIMEHGCRMHVSRYTSSQSYYDNYKEDQDNEF